MFRHNSFLITIFEGKIPGKKIKGRLRTSLLRNITNTMDFEYYGVQNRNGNRQEDVARATRHCLQKAKKPSADINECISSDIHYILQKVRSLPQKSLLNVFVKRLDY